MFLFVRASPWNDVKWSSKFYRKSQEYQMHLLVQVSFSLWCSPWWVLKIVLHLPWWNVTQMLVPRFKDKRNCLILGRLGSTCRVRYLCNWGGWVILNSDAQRRQRFSRIAVAVVCHCWELLLAYHNVLYNLFHWFDIRRFYMALFPLTPANRYARSKMRKS